MRVANSFGSRAFQAVDDECYGFSPLKKGENREELTVTRTIVVSAVAIALLGSVVGSISATPKGVPPEPALAQAFK